jgi:glycosyltransferase involved in cell wall biosynthesis
MQKEIYIWGAGHYGVLTTLRLKNEGVKIKGFIDRDAKLIKIRLGLPVLELNEIKNENSQIIIAIQNEEAIKEIMETLSLHEFKFEISPLVPKPKEYFKICKKETLDLIPTLKLLESKNSTKYIVSLTSYGKRLTDTAPYAIVTLLNQSVKPDKIILWVANEDEEKIPQIMEELTQKGLEIRFCEDIKSYKKLIFALETFPDDYIITADDDVYYPENWLEQLIAEHEKHPEKIICHHAHGIKVDENCNLLPYSQWDCYIKRKDYFNKLEVIFPVGVGGILYPPKCFNKDIANEELFMKLAPQADDIWFWAMAVTNKEYFGKESPCILIENGYSRNLQIIEPEQDQGKNALWNYNHSQGGNDKQFKAVIEHYPQIREYLNKIKPSIFPKISIIIPMYNAAEWLDRCFNSIVKQIYKNDKMECIFVDDCSTDNSAEILENMIKNYNGEIKFKIVKHKKNAGPSKGRNTGIDNATGEYIFFMDADDEISENALFYLADLTCKYENVDIVQGNTKRIEAIRDGKEILNPTWDIAMYGFPEFVNDKLWIKERLGQWNRKDGYIPHSPCNKLLRKNFIIDNQLYFNPEHGIGEDQSWLWFVSKKIQSIAFVNSVTYIYHREHPISTTRGNNKDVFVSYCFKVLQTMLNNLDMEIADVQLPFINSFFIRYIKPELDKNPALKSKYQKDIIELKNSYHLTLSDE